MGDDEFYVGFAHPAPPRTARWLRGFVSVAIVGGAFAAGMLVAALRPFDAGFFEFGSPRDFDGVIVMTPAPSLLIERPGAPGALNGFARLWLAGPGKGGADAIVAPFDGKAVHVHAQAAYREGETFLKVSEGDVTLLPADGLAHTAEAVLASKPRIVGPIEASGEIVDPQCWVGLMKPGDGVPHRACAIRCLAGGVPPVLLSRDADGRAHFHLLLGADGQPITRELLPYAAESITLSGTEVAYGEALAIHVAKGADGVGFD